MRKNKINFKFSMNEKLLFSIILLSQINTKKMFFNIGGISIRPFFIIMIIAMIKIAIDSLKGKKMIFKNLIPFYIMLIIAVVNYFNNKFYNNISDFFRAIFFFETQIILLFVIINLSRTSSKNKIYVMLKITLITTSLLAIMLFTIQIYLTSGSFNTSYLGVYYGHNGIPRMTGLFDDPNYFGMFITIMMMLYLCYTNKFTNMDKMAIFLAIICILLTQSRSALLVNFIAIFLYLINLKREKFIKNIILLIISGVIGLIILNYIIPDFVNIIQDRLTFSENDAGSANERFMLLQLGLKSSFTYPLGVGINNSGELFKDYFGTYKLIHNDFITVLLELGIIGVCEYLYYFFKIYLRSDYRGKILIIAFILYLNTLTSYSYEVIIPIVFGIMLVKNRNDCYIGWD